ncbi:hypothetical protein RBH94_15500 [Aestuariibaculum sp. YM273]|uniref:hypothetical protein n=1 Tax=Aestuariibaculum sp. YM273 TaxID=3070659 RepID=UPI0027DCE9EE|nr:hypothetical protein [Aestuariibaculum sp. YM273]WMI65457.1 hypothetical protein RBH94_15500 [Aestuariibaculum sp. YM273]
MKRTIIIITLLFSFSLIAQEKLVGEFCTIPIGESNVACYNFIENNNFEFMVSGCLGISTYGKGKYILNNDKLLLNFDSGKGIENSSITFKNLSEISKDSVTVKLKVTDLNGIGIAAKIYPKEMDLMDFDFEKNYADVDGNWILKDKKGNGLKYFVISEVGYVELEFAIDMAKSQEINIVLAPPSPDSISSKELFKKIKIVDSDILEIDGIKFKRIK